MNDYLQGGRLPSDPDNFWDTKKNGPCPYPEFVERMNDDLFDQDPEYDGTGYDTELDDDDRQPHGQSGSDSDSEEPSA